MLYASRVIETALAEVGYLEKASNADLDSKTANAGKGNYTKYARDLDAVTGFYNGKKNGYAWCDIFVDWCFVKTFGVDTAKKLLCQSGTLGAGCAFSMRYYKNSGQLYSKPSAGDQIFFKKGDDITHTGLVYDVDDSYVYTVEGNTSGSKGVVANGGCVCKKKYKLTYSRIAGYGRPAYDENTEDTANKGGNTVTVTLSVLKKGVRGEQVKTLQRLLFAMGYKDKGGDSLAVDGSFGAKTDYALRAYQSANGLNADGSCGPATWNSLLK